MKSFLVTFTVLPFFAAGAMAVSVVTIEGDPEGRYLIDLEGNRLANGNLVLVGSVANESVLDTALPLPADNLMSLIGWETFGDTFTDSIFDNTGKIVGDVINESSLATDFANRQIFVWVFNSDTVWGATQYGIFTVSNDTSPWIFPEGGGYFDRVFISMDDSSLIAKLGSVNGMELGLVGVIPEPMSYAAVLALGSLLTVSICRRRSRKATRTA